MTRYRPLMGVCEVCGMAMIVLVKVTQNSPYFFANVSEFSEPVPTLADLLSFDLREGI